MRCEYGDGLKVKYSGPLQITRGSDINVFIREDLIPGEVKSDLDMALYRNSCGAMRSVADTVTAMYGNKACIHE